MRPFLAIAVLSASVALAVPAAAQDAFVASEDALVIAAGGEPQGRTPAAMDIYTAWGHDFELFIGTEGPVNQTTGARPCAAGPCGWAAGLHLPSGAQIHGVEFSACDGDATQQLSFTLLRCPKVAGACPHLFPFTGTGIAETPGCTTFTATLPTPETVQNKAYSYVFIVNSMPGTNLEWNQFRAVYTLP
jgi:hypothetical protein